MLACVGPEKVTNDPQTSGILILVQESQKVKIAIEFLYQ